MANERRLFVLVHGFTRSPEDFCELARLIEAQHPEAHCLRIRLPLGLFAATRAHVLASRLAADVGQAWDDAASTGAPWDKIVLIGHSMGGQLLRAAFAEAAGIGPDATRTGEPAAWTLNVSRIVLLAAVARGWQSNVAMSPGFRLALWFGGLIDHLPFRRLTIFDLRRGSAFQTMLRLQWLALRAVPSAPGAQVPVVQVLGDIDDLMPPSDHVDLATGGGFHYLEVPDTDHLNIVRPDTPDRDRVLRLALFGSLVDLKRQSTPADQIADVYGAGVDDVDDRDGDASDAGAVSHVAMIVHGIRDHGFWTPKLARRLQALADQNRNIACRTVTSSYGFFPMGPFLSRTARLRRVEWFMDQYVECRARFPRAKISFIGHSNGTYLLARALELCPALRFEAVVFAGSVVRPNYDWITPLGRGQVRRVLNYVATRDLIVAAFPKFLGRLRVFDLGSAGHDGFLEEPPVQNVRFAPGGHDAAIRREHWDDIAAFVLAGDQVPTVLPSERRVRRRDEIFPWIASWLAVPVLVVVAALFAAGVFFAVTCWLPNFLLIPVLTGILVVAGIGLFLARY